MQFKLSIIFIGLTMIPILNASEVSIEAFQAERDKNAVLKIVQANADFLAYESLGYQDGTTEKYLMSPNYITEVLRVDGQTVGFINYFHRDLTFLSFFIQRAAGIHLVGVAETYRGNGYGRGLVNHALDELKKNNVPKVSLSVKKENKIALALYESMGFRCRNLISQDYMEKWPASVPLIYELSLEVSPEMLPQGNWIQRNPIYVGALGLTAGVLFYAAKYHKK